MGETSKAYNGPQTEMMLAFSAEKSARAGGRDFRKSKRTIIQEKPKNSDIFGAPYELPDKSIGYNRVANTKMAKAKYADKAPKINLRKSYED